MAAYGRVVGAGMAPCRGLRTAAATEVRWEQNERPVRAHFVTKALRLSDFAQSAADRSGPGFANDSGSPCTRQPESARPRPEYRMLATLCGSRSRYCCLSSAFGSFWRAAKRNSPESAQRVAKSKLILIVSVQDRLPLWTHFNGLRVHTQKNQRQFRHAGFARFLARYF